jgi:spore germination cell wall hydrolase CwlJ-like protein
MTRTIFKFFVAFSLTFLSFGTNTIHQSNSTSGFVEDYHHRTKEFQCIREALYYEARGESEEGIRSVLSVIYNRKQAKGFPESYCGVIHQKLQFSYRNGTQPGIHLEIKPVKQLDHKAYALVSSIAEEAAYGRFKPVLGPNVLWYHTKEVKPRWSRFMQKVKTVTNHHFFAKKETK